jgi:hypothetical protein
MKKIYVTVGFLATLMLACLTGLAQTQSRSDIQKQIEAKRAELESLEQLYLAPSEGDRAAHAGFLKQPNTGLIRLLPREKFDSDAYKENKKTITMRGGGAYYSFALLTHEYGYGSDLSLDHGQLECGGFGGASYGFMTNIGDIPIETAGPETPGVTFFAAYNAPREEELARKEYYRLARGADIHKMPVAKRVPLQVNTTYLLRSINFGSSDVLVVLRVVRVDSDGSAIIAWKMIKKYETPELKRSVPKTVG